MYHYQYQFILYHYHCVPVYHYQFILYHYHCVPLPVYSVPLPDIKMIVSQALFLPLSWGEPPHITVSVMVIWALKFIYNYLSDSELTLCG